MEMNSNGFRYNLKKFLSKNFFQMMDYCSFVRLVSKFVQQNIC